MNILNEGILSPFRFVAFKDTFTEVRLEIDWYNSKESDNKLEISRWAQIIARSVEVKEQREFDKKLMLVQVERNEICTQLYEMRVARLSVIISSYQRHVMVCKRVTTVQRAVEALS